MSAPFYTPGAHKILKQEFPVLYESIFNRRYRLPAKLQNDYHDVRLIQELQLNDILEDQRPSMSKGADMRLGSFITALHHGLESEYPTRYLDKELVQKFRETDIPDDLDFEDFKMPYPHMRIVLPKGVRMAGKFNGEENHEVELLSVSITLSDTGTYQLPKTIVDELHSHSIWCGDIKEEFKSAIHRLIVTAHARDNEDYTTRYTCFSSVKALKDAPQGGSEFCVLAINTVMYMVHVPTVDAVPQDHRIRGDKVKGNGVTLPDLYEARFVGEARIVHPAKPYPQHSEGKGIPKRTHWRRGHWTLVVHGKGRALRRRQWIQPMFIGLE